MSNTMGLHINLQSEYLRHKSSRSEQRGGCGIAVIIQALSPTAPEWNANIIHCIYTPGSQMKSAEERLQIEVWDLTLFIFLIWVPVVINPNKLLENNIKDC